MTTENSINKWADAMSALPDKQFFNTMRLYLGEIKTPYNKQRLIQQLAGFVRNPQNAKSIITLLDRFDVEVLTAISLIPQVTQETLVEFFKGTYSVTELYAEILNLTERLIIYKEVQQYSTKEIFYINPLLADDLKPFLNTKLLFPDFQVTFFSTDDVFTLSPNLLGAFISFLKVRGIACKTDGTIKKNEMTRLEEIFPGKQAFIQLLMNAFVNLNLVVETEKNFQLAKGRVEAFAKLSENQQYALLCAAAVSRFSKEGLKKEAQLLMDCLTSIPEGGYTRSAILRLAFLMGTMKGDGGEPVKKSRFSMMLEAARQEDGNIPEQNADMLDRMIEAAIEFGLLQKLGRTEDGEELFKAADGSAAGTGTGVGGGSAGENPKVLNLDSTFTVTLMPGLSLNQLLPLTSFMIIKKTGVVTEFEITKQSVSSSFDAGWTPDTIFEAITNHSYYEIPQNLKINITDWYHSYSSAMLYHGYVLKVSETNVSFVENNPNIKKYLKEKLAEGIYLLNLPVDFDISYFIDESGLEFLGKVRTSTEQSEFTSFPLLREGTKPAVLSKLSATEGKETSIPESAKLLESLKAKINLREDLNPLQKESLSYRISNRLILSEEHLKIAAIRSEILEAVGMDFGGKVHLIDAAIKEEDLMEIQLPNLEHPEDYISLVGHPLGMSKQPGEAVMRFRIEPTGDIENFLVSKISYLRRIRF